MSKRSGLDNRQEPVQRQIKWNAKRSEDLRRNETEQQKRVSKPEHKGDQWAQEDIQDEPDR